MIKVIIAVILALLVFTVIAIKPVLSAGSGYSAKNLCSGHFLSRFKPETIRDEALHGASPLLAYVNYEFMDNRVRTDFFGLFERQAIFHPGSGCTLLPPGTEKLATENEIQEAAKLLSFAKSQMPINSLTVNINASLDKILETGFEESDIQNPKNTKAIVVLHRGEVVAERYAEGVDSNTPLIGWSMSKSLTNILLGLLEADGLIKLNTPLGGEAGLVAEWQDERRYITISHLLQMSSGLNFEEDYGVSSDLTKMLSLESDMGGFAAAQSAQFKAGEHWAYSSGTTNILSRITKQVLGGELKGFYAYLNRRLLQPLTITSLSFEVDASANPIGSSYVYASARDWAKLGLLFLQKGQWQGEQILPEAWVDYSLTPARNEKGNFHGAHWWLNLAPSNNKERALPSLPQDSFAMDGYQGQAVVVVPSKDLVFVRLGFTPSENPGTEALVADIIAVLEMPH